MSLIDGSRTAAEVFAAWGRYGLTTTLRRRVGTTNTFTDVQVKAVFRNYEPRELIGALQQGDAEFTLPATGYGGWPVPPQKGDFLVSQSRTWAVQGVDSVHVGDTIVAYKLWCRGG